MTNVASKTIILGNEWDAALKSRLRHVLKGLGAVTTNHDWAMAGSQELELLTATVGGDEIRVQAETYIGLSVSGPPELVEKVSALVSAEDSQAE